MNYLYCVKCGQLWGDGAEHRKCQQTQGATLQELEAQHRSKTFLNAAAPQLLAALLASKLASDKPEMWHEDPELARDAYDLAEILDAERVRRGL